MSRMDKDICEVLLTHEEIQRRVAQLAAEVSRDYEGRELVLVCVLNGAAPFYIDLMMALGIPLEMNFIRVSNYGAGTASSGNVRILYDLETDITGKHVLLVEDIIDSGNTLKKLTTLLLERGAASVRCCCLLDKKERREVEMEADYVGFDIPDAFVVGYGLDYGGIYRNLNYIGTLKSEIYSQ